MEEKKRLSIEVVMKNFYEVPKILTTDELTDFITNFNYKLKAFGHQIKDPNILCKKRITSDFELLFIKDGESVITIGDKQYNCESGDMILIPPFTLHSIIPNQNNPHDNYWIHFDVFPVHMQGMFLDAYVYDLEYKISVKKTEEILQVYSTLEQELQQKRLGNMIMADVLLKQLIVYILREKDNTFSVTYSKFVNNSDKKIINSSIQFIQDNLYNTIKIKDICSFLHVSESTLFKVFSKTLDSSPNYFIQLCKIKAAEQLMKSTDISIKEISQTLSFSSPYYFSSVFKNFYGISPREYINSQK